MVRRAVSTAFVLLVSTGALSAQQLVLTLDDVVSRARDRAPAVLSALARVEEARARLVGASQRFRENPEIEAAAGPRTNGTRTVDFELGLRQTFEPPVRRRARLAGVQAGIDVAIAQSEEARRLVVRDAVNAFLRALHAEQRVLLTTNTESVAAQIFSTAERRFQAGDVPVLDVNLARAALSRQRAEIRSAEAEREAALGELRPLVGLPPAQVIAVRGDLKDRGLFDLNQLVHSALGRADVRALTAAIQEAQTEVTLARTATRPQFGAGLQVQREESARVLLGALTVTVPLFERGRGPAAEAEARARRLRLDRDILVQTLESELRAAHSVYERRLTAVDELEQHALPALEENDLLSRRSYEEGELGLVELLLLRRDALDTQTRHLDTLLEAALARVALQVSAGVLK